MTEKTIYDYYNKLKNPTYILKDWVIASDETYLKYKKKLTITDIISRIYDDVRDESIIVFEDKKRYYAIKYNDKFICIKPSETEYGLVIGDYSLLAINRYFAYAENKKEYKKNNKISPDDLNIKYFCSLFEWKLTNRAKDNIDYFN
jgi:hypothetical protein